MGTGAKVLKPTYEVIAHGVRTSKEVIDPEDQKKAIEKIQAESAAVYLGAEVTYMGWLTKTGKKKTASSLVCASAGIQSPPEQSVQLVLTEGSAAMT